MNREDIIRIARDAGAIPIHERPKELAVVGNENIERFFQAAYDAGAAAERNSWPAEMEAMERQVNILTDALAQAKAEEREVCAKVCESMEYEFKAGHECAEAIRARGETK